MQVIKYHTTIFFLMLEIYTEEVTTEAETTLPETTRWNQPVGTLYGPPEVLEQFEH